MKSTLEPTVAGLHEHATRLKQQRIRALFESESRRLQDMTFTAAGVTLDVSKNLLDRAALGLLVELAETAGVASATAAMVRGEAVNFTEMRPALHTALRQQKFAPTAEQSPYSDEVAAVEQQLAQFVDDVHQRRRTGYTGAAFTDVVNIGIGGSHLGPQLACDALRYAANSHLNVHFLANVDGGEFDRVVASLNPATTLFIVASKSFATVETRLNANSARAWLMARQPDVAAIAQHFIAVSANPERAVEFGIAVENVFPMWDWVGGRYSMWSAIGLPIALKFGMPVLQELRAGAADMDSHFSSAALGANLPVLLALTGIWNTNFLGAETVAVIPYDDRLRFLPDYLQQLEMESNGKRVTRQNCIVEHHSAPITWGGLGTNAQHAFFQLLHQGTRLVPVDFIIALSHPAARPEHHDMLVANCIAQAEGLMNGSMLDARDAAIHRQTPGNRPSTMLSMDTLTPSVLGALIALYEHKTFVQSVIWDINAFDQWGVELGKHLASAVLAEFSGAAASEPHDPSTAALIRRYRDLHGR
jgi:glucose-6-phosphate isomerase